MSFWLSQKGERKSTNSHPLTLFGICRLQDKCFKKDFVDKAISRQHFKQKGKQITIRFSTKL